MTGVGLPFFTDGVVDVSSFQAEVSQCTQAVKELVHLLRTPSTGNHIGAAILQGRARRGWTQKKLAEMAQSARPSVAAWESGRAKPSAVRWVMLVDLMPELALVARVANGRVVALSLSEDFKKGDHLART
jgi:ribosome-binding protein aMBF1 (putative translation factor)